MKYKVFSLGVQAPDLGAGVEVEADARLQLRGLHDVCVGDGRGGAGARHARGAAPLQLPHRGGQLQHQHVALLNQAEVLLGHLLAPDEHYWF